MYEMKITQAKVLAHKQGVLFTQTLLDNEKMFAKIFAFLSQSAIQLRMQDAEIHHNRPALSGMVWELERIPEVKAFFENNPPKDTLRFRQCMGVITKIVMQDLGWKRTGTKAAVGTGVSQYFQKAERYTPPH